MVKTILGVILCANMFLPGQDLPATPQDGPFRSPFRYIIFHHYVNNEDYLVDPTKSRRSIEIFLQDKDFNETNLRTLFGLVAKRYPAPIVLSVRVYTSIETILTPEEMDMGRPAHGPPNPDADKYHKSNYLRDKIGNEWFGYNPNPPSREYVVVVIKGKSPYPTR
jgi:hypothetical protein